MEYLNENQQPDEVDAYEDCIHVIAESFQSPDATAEQIKQFGAHFSDQTPEDREYIGFLMNGVVAASPEINTVDDPRLAACTFINGAMTGLYVGNTMLGECMSTKDVLLTSKNMIEFGAREFYQQVEKLIAHMNPETRQILNSWRTSLGSAEAHKPFFDLGFGVTMASVNKTINEIDLFRDLENTTNWDELNNEVNPEPVVVSVDSDCLMLAKAFRDRSEAVRFDQLPVGERQAAFQKIAKLLLTDVYRTKELKPKDYIQTRGIGACIGYDEHNEPEDMYEYGDAIKIRGRLARVDCMSVPTEFAMMMGDRDEPYQPQVCLVLDNVELVEPNGDITPHDNCVAIPLRISGTTQLDKILRQEG